MESSAPTVPDDQGHVTGEEVVSIWAGLCVRVVPTVTEVHEGCWLSQQQVGWLARGSQAASLWDGEEGVGD